MFSNLWHVTLCVCVCVCVCECVCVCGGGGGGGDALWFKVGKEGKKEYQDLLVRM